MLASHGVKVAILDMNAERGEAVARDIGAVFCRRRDRRSSIDRGLRSPRGQRHRAHSRQLRGHRAGQAHRREEARNRRADRARCRRASAARSRSTSSAPTPMIAKCCRRHGRARSGDAGRRRGVIVNTSRLRRRTGRSGRRPMPPPRGRARSRCRWPAIFRLGIRVMSIMPACSSTPLLRASPRNTARRWRPTCLPLASRTAGGIRDAGQGDHRERHAQCAKASASTALCACSRSRKAQDVTSPRFSG